MSFDASRWAWHAPVKNSGQRLVLLSLADRADGSRQCWPAQGRIARDTLMGERTVRERLAELEGLGLIRRQHRRNSRGRTSDLIVLLMDGEINRPASREVASLAAADTAINRQQPPRPTGASRRLIDQEITHQIEPGHTAGTPSWLEIMPEPGRPDIDRHNHAVNFADDIANAIATADWSSPGFTSLAIVGDWLERFGEPLLRRCLIETAGRADRAGTRIRSWAYFAKAVDALDLIAPKSREPT